MTVGLITEEMSGLYTEHGFIDGKQHRVNVRLLCPGYKFEGGISANMYKCGSKTGIIRRCILCHETNMKMSPCLTV